MARSCRAVGRLQYYWTVLVLPVHLANELIGNRLQKLHLLLASPWQVQHINSSKQRCVLSFIFRHRTGDFIFPNWMEKGLRKCHKRLQRLLCSALGDLNLGHIT